MDDAPARSENSVQAGPAAVRRYARLAALLGAFAVCLVGAAGVLMGATSSTGFCLGCHEMKINQDELALSSHAKDAEGREIGCGQCHLPRGIGPRYLAVKTYSGIKDLYAHFVSSPQSLDRRALQTAARRFVDDASCLQCHADLYKDAKNKGAVSALGKIAHDSYYGLDGKTYRGCADCHANIAHLPDFDRRLTMNKKFAESLAARNQKGGER